MDSALPLLSVTGLSKRYGVIRALSDISISLYRGQVLGVLGDNGAGKSTLVNILAGVTRQTRGRIQFAGGPIALRSPADAHHLGIETVYQDLALANDLTAWQNIFLGSEKTRSGVLGRLGWLDRETMQADATAAVANTGIKLDSVEAMCGQLSGGQRQLTAITSAFAWARTALLLDEPTSALGPHERSRVNALISEAANRGLAVLLVTQDLAQAEVLCDRCVVLRRGRLVVEVARGAMSTGELIKYITGARTEDSPGASSSKHRVSAHAAVASEPDVRRLHAEARHDASTEPLPVPDANGSRAVAVKSDHVPRLTREPLVFVEGISKQYGAVTALADIDLRLYPGEVLGLVGHNGAGKSTLVGVLSGTVRPSNGRIMLEGNELTLRSPLDAQVAGIETVYQDLALAPELNGWQNVFLGHERTRGGILGRLGWLDHRAMAAATQAGVAELRLNLGSVETPGLDLSGGQRQTLAIVRAQMRGRKVVLFDEPTSALSVEEQNHVNDLLRSLATKGMAVLLITHNLPKAHELCDRIAVLEMGRVVADLDPRECSLDDLVHHVVGDTVDV